MVPVWERGKESLHIKEGNGKYKSLKMLSLGNSEGSKGKDVEAEIVYVKNKEDNVVYPYFTILQNSEWLVCTVNSNQSFRFNISKTVASNKFEEEILTDLQTQFHTLKIFNKYIKKGQAIVTEKFSIINNLKKYGQNKEDVKKILEQTDIDTNKVLLSNTEFYLIAIRKAIIENFDNIWNAL